MDASQNMAAPEEKSTDNINIEQGVINICCIGAGYVGALPMLVMAKHCSNVNITVVDKDIELIENWKQGLLPFHEPDLKKLVAVVANTQRLTFSDEIDAAIRDANIIFVAVNLPKEKGKAKKARMELGSWEEVLKRIARLGFDGKIIVEKSAVPFETEEYLKVILKQYNREYSVISNPEVFTQGRAIHDLENPSQVVLACTDNEAIKTIAKLYSQWVDAEKIVELNNVRSAKLGKLAMSASLAMQACMASALSAICYKIGADFSEVSTIMSKHPGIDYFSGGCGDSDINKDVGYLAYVAESYRLTNVASLFKQIVKVNEMAYTDFVMNMEQKFVTFKQKKFAVLGGAYKVSGINNSPAIEVSKLLVKEQAEVAIFDPKVCEADIVQALIGLRRDRSKVSVKTDAYKACAGVDAICILGDWNDFLNLDYRRLHQVTRKNYYGPFIFFGRKVDTDLSNLRNLGFQVCWFPTM